MNLDRTITLGDLVTGVAIVASAIASVLALSCSWSQDRELVRRQQADQVRSAAVDAVARLERWEDLSLSLFDAVQPAFVETSRRLTAGRAEEQVFAARDYLYSRLVEARLTIQSTRRDENAEATYVRLVAHRPLLRLRFQETFAVLKARERDMFDELLGAVETEVLAYLASDLQRGRYFSAALGNALRGAALAVRRTFESEVHSTLAPLECLLTKLIRTPDEQLLAFDEIAALPKDQ